MNRVLLAFLGVWGCSWIILFVDGGTTLQNAPASPAGFLAGEAIVAAFVVVLWWMTRNRRPIDHESELPFRYPLAETVLVFLYLVAVVVVGSLLGLRSHIASLGLTERTIHAWEQHTSESVLSWAGYYGLFGAVVPFLVFRFWRGYTLPTLLLRFPEPKKWIPYVVVTGVLGVGGFVGPAYFETTLVAHLLTVAIFSFGTFLPVMMLTQCLLAPRFASLSRSWITGAVLTGIAYGVYHCGEFYLAWTTPNEVVVSLAWLMQFVYFGFLKGVTTLRSHSAWIHIFNTHTPHLAEAPAIARIFGFV